MSAMPIRPTRDPAEARAFLSAQLGAPVERVVPLAGGAIAQAFGFEAAGQQLVARFSRGGEGFAKDEFAWSHFRSATLPIPRVIQRGTAGDDFFAISERVPGRTLDRLSDAERRALLPATLDTLDAVAAADISATRGYGYWDGSGNGSSPSWHAYLASCNENIATGFYANWHALFNESFMERDLYERVYAHMLRLAEHCPEERALIHCDFQYENVLADTGSITGVIDWANALYGDPLYDVAWLAHIATHPGWWHADGVEQLRARYGAAPHYATRIACYQCHIGLDNMRFYARTGNPEGYAWNRGELLRLLECEPEE